MQPQRTELRSAVRWLSTILLFAFIFALAMPMGAFAAGTVSGTLITNRATVDYEVGGQPQTQIRSDDPDQPGADDATAFLVDNRVDLTMTAPAGINVTPGTISLEWQVTLRNTGNTNQGYRIVIQDAGGLPADDMTDVRIYLDDDPGSVGSFDSANDTLYYTFDPASPPGTFNLPGNQERASDVNYDTDLILWVQATVPASATDGQTAAYNLIATTLDPGTDDVTGEDSADTWDPLSATPQVVFGDGNRAADIAEDGAMSTTITYTVATATLSATKAQTVIDDGFSASNPKAIPGAEMEYVITVTNGGGTDADDVVIIDAIPTNTTFDDTFVVVATNSDGGVVPSIEYSPVGIAGPWQGTVPTAPAEALAIRVTNLRVLSGGGTATLTFHVTID